MAREHRNRQAVAAAATKARRHLRRAISAEERLAVASTAAMIALRGLMEWADRLPPDSTKGSAFIDAIEALEQLVAQQHPDSVISRGERVVVSFGVHDVPPLPFKGDDAKRRAWLRQNAFSIEAEICEVGEEAIERMVRRDACIGGIDGLDGDESDGLWDAIGNRKSNLWDLSILDGESKANGETDGATG